MASIYQLTDSYKQLQQIIEDGAEGLEEVLAGMQGDVETKLDNYAMVLKNIQADVDALKAEEKRLKDRRISLENSIVKMKQAMSDALETIEPDAKTGKKKVKTEKFTFYFTERSSTKYDETKLPAYLLTEQKQYVPDKERIEQELEKGIEIPGVITTTNKALAMR